MLKFLLYFLYFSFLGSYLMSFRAFYPYPELLSMGKKDWEEITEETFREVFRKSAVKRTKYSGLKRNIDFLKD